MSKRLIGIVLAAVGSIALGLLAETWFFSLFDRSVPQAMMTSLNRNAIHSIFYAYGFGLGAVIFVWTLLAVVLARFFPGTPKPPGSPR